MNAFAQARTFPPFATRFAPPPRLALSRRASPASAPVYAPVIAPPSTVQRQLEQTLAERERAVADAEHRLAERTRDLDEWDALLRAREALLDAARQPDTSKTACVTLREAAALNELKAELDRQETLLREARDALREREKFVEDSETRLFAKVQQQQEKEVELAQREENLATRPAPAASAAPAPFDEFRE